ncbi:hypothetical protein BC941DRAFT_427839 [Chlamydoabsidia padenii]|nr:hypothetical protein BC941DRAFT_427839 [Chlamydoabsidia padenii]
MWPALIRGSVFSSIRNSALLPSDTPSDDSLPSLQHNIIHHNPVDSNTQSTNTKCAMTDNNNNDNNTSDYNLNIWMKKGIINDSTPAPVLSTSRRCEMLSIKELTTNSQAPSTLSSPWTTQTLLGPPEYRLKAEPPQNTNQSSIPSVTMQRNYCMNEGGYDDDYEGNAFSDDDQDLQSTKKETVKEHLLLNHKWKYESSTILSPSADNDSNHDLSLKKIKKKKKTTKDGNNLEDRPHACTICDRRFNRRYNLNAHIRTHDPHRKKLFDCSSCHQSFDRKHDRDRHMDALHYARKHRYLCDLCNASFSRRDALARHMHKLHTSSPSSSSS